MAAEIDIIQLRKEQHKRIELQELRRDDFIGVLGVWGPIAIPLIPAALTAIAIATHYPELLNINFWVAVSLGVIAAGGIEVLGIVSTETFLQMRSYNQMRSDEDESAPVGAAGIVAGCYLLVVLALVVLLKVFPVMAIYSLIPLTTLGALVSWIVVLRKQHNQRVLEQMSRAQTIDQVTELTSTIDQLRSDIEQMGSQSESLSRELNKAQMSNVELQTLNSELAKTSDSVNANNEQLSGQIDALSKQVMSAQMDSERMTTLNTELRKNIEQLTTSSQQELSLLRDDLTSKIEQLNSQLSAQSDQLEAALSEHETAQQEIDRLTKLNNRLTSKIEQLTNQLDTPSIAPIAKMTTPIVYHNGDIVHGTEHLPTNDQIVAIAQRMVDSGQKVNKSKIATLVNCSRTTVQTVLKDW